MQNVSKKIAYAELMITSIVLITLIPYIIVNMGYSPLQLFHYVNITMFILAPLGFMSLFYFLDRGSAPATIAGVIAATIAAASSSSTRAATAPGLRSQDHQPAAANAAALAAPTARKVRRRIYQQG